MNLAAVEPYLEQVVLILTILGKTLKYLVKFVVIYMVVACDEIIALQLFANAFVNKHNNQ